MLKRKLFILFIIIPFSIFGKILQYKQYNVEQGLLQSYVKSITQLPDHQMVFSTASGICYYNGVKFETLNDSVFNSFATCITSVDSMLWIGTFSSGIFIVSKNKIIHNYNSKNFPIGNRINSIKKIEEKTYIASNNGLTIISKNDTTIYNRDSGLQSSIVLKFDIDDKQNIWLTSINGFSVITFYGEIINISNRKLFKNPFCETIRYDGHGNIWVGTREGLLVFSRKKFLESKTIESSYWFYEKNIPNDFITKIIKDEFGDMWISTKKGVLKYEFDDNINNSIQKINLDQFIYYPINNYFIKDIFLDVEHNIWLGTRGGGVIKIQGDIFWTYSLEDGLRNREVLSIFQSENRDIWLGTNNGIARIRGKKIRTYTTRDGLSNRVVPSFSESSDGTILIGTWNGLTLYKNGYFSKIKNPNKIEGFRILDIESSDGRLFYLATNKGLFTFNIKNRKIRVYDKVDKVNKKVIYDISFKNDSIINVVAIKDIFQINLENSNFFSFNQKYNLNSDMVLTVNFVPKLGTFVGCRQGLYILNDDSITHHFTDENYLIDNNIISIVPVGEKQFWVGSNKGVSFITFSDDNKIFSKHYSLKNGFIGEEIITHNSMYKDKDGNVWFGTFLGVSKYLKDKDVINTSPPVVKIEKIKVFYKEASTQYLQNLRYDQNSISITFVGISFRDENDVVYKYRLLGQNDKWSEITASREANFYNLKSGDYIFEVLARNKDGFWSSKPASAKIVIKKPFWQTRVFFFLFILIITLIIYLFFRERISKISREKKKLELKVQERTKTLIEQQRQLLKNNEELGVLTEDLKKSMHKLQNAQIHLVQSEKMASLGTLIAGVTHEINNPITFIYSNFNSLKEYFDSITKLITSLKKENLLKNSAINKIYEEEDLDYIIEDLPELLNGIEYGANRIKDTVMQLYRFSHPGLDNDKININENLQLTLNLFLNQYKRQISVETDFGDIPIIEAPGNEINQVILNLLVNSAHAIISSKNSGNIWIKTYFQDREAVIEIVDNGGGIPKNIQDRIFDPFFTTKPIGKGTGMGLSLSYNILKKIGGNLLFQNTTDGVKFTVFIPLSKKG